VRKIYGQTKPPLGAKINFAHPLAKGIVGCWLMNEGGGNKVYDLSGNGNTGTLTNMSLPSTSTSGWNPGRFGRCLAFDGSNDYVDLSGVHRQMTSDFSVFIWVKTISTGWGIIFGNYNGGTSLVFQLHIVTGVLDLYTSIGASGTTFSSITAINDGKYHFVGVTRVGVLGTIWIDGLPSNTGASKPGDLYSGINYRLGVDSRVGGGLNFGGIEDSLLVFNRALSAQEVLQLYREPFSMFNR
jgi:hypothetical protein